jgi:putative ABC transport system permease protein
MNLRWLLLMAWRDSRKNRSRLFLFMGSISAGIAALVAIYSFGSDLNRSVDEQAATLVGADFTVSHNRPPDSAQTRYLADIGPVRSEEEQFNSMVLFPKNGSSRFVQVRALQGGFPYYGELETVPVSAAADFRGRQAALVDHSLMLQYGIRVGDSIKVGYQTFVIDGALDKAPSQSGFSASLAPVVYIPLSYMKRTGLEQTGSRILYKWYYHFGKDIDVDALADRVTPWLDRHGMSHETVAMRKENTGRAFENMTHFLSLVGFAALLLGCIGVASAVQIYIREKAPTIAVMRCLGVTVSKAFYIYLFQVAGIGLIGSFIGVVAGVFLQWILPLAFGDLLPVEVKTAISWAAVGQGLIIGLVIAVLFGFLPLLSIRRITPLNTLRANYEKTFQSLDPYRVPVYLGMISFITCFARIQLKSWEQACYFTLGLLLAYALLTLVAIGLRRLLRVIMRNSAWRFSIRQGFTNLYRPNNQTIVLVVAIGLSTALVSGYFNGAIGAGFFKKPGQYDPFRYTDQSGKQFGFPDQNAGHACPGEGPHPDYAYNSHQRLYC